MNHLFFLTTITTLFLSLGVSNASFYDVMGKEYQEGYEACVKSIDGSKLLEFHNMQPEKQADFCVDRLRKKRPDILKIINIPTFKEGIVKGFYKNGSSEKN